MSYTVNGKEIRDANGNIVATASSELMAARISKTLTQRPQLESVALAARDLVDGIVRNQPMSKLNPLMETIFKGVQAMKNLMIVAALLTLSACQGGGEASGVSVSMEDNNNAVHVCINPVQYGLTCSGIGKLENGRSDVQVCTTGSTGGDRALMARVQEYMNSEAGYLNQEPRLSVSLSSFNNDVLGWFTPEQLEGFTPTQTAYENMYSGIVIASQDPSRAFLSDSCQ